MGSSETICENFCYFIYKCKKKDIVQYYNNVIIIDHYNLKYFFILFLFILVLNIVSFTRGIKRLSSNERDLILIPDDLKEVLIGILLGDGHIARRSLMSNSRLVYAQSGIKNKEYFYHVYNLFKIFCTNEYKPYYKISKDNRTEKFYTSISFTTMQLPCFNIYRESFYYLHTKKVPDNIYELLTAKGLAFWIMDDGSRHGDGLHISTYAFSSNDIDKLMFVLEDKFKLKCSIHYNKEKKTTYLYIQRIYE